MLFHAFFIFLSLLFGLKYQVFSEIKIGIITDDNIGVFTWQQKVGIG